MNILGLGMDLVELSRISETMTRFGDRFTQRILTPEECERLPENLVQRCQYVASRFAAKEAAVKAMGTGFVKGIGFQDIVIRSLPSGRPELLLYGEAQDHARRMGVVALHITLTHTRDNAAAVVILEGKTPCL